MPVYSYDHIHLRSPNPDATAHFFETMFAAEVTRDIYPPGTLYPGQMRVRMKVGGQTVLIAPPHPHEKTGPAPGFPHYGLEHFGLTVDNLDAAVADFSEELRPQAPQTAQELLPLPVTTAEVLSVDFNDSEAVAVIRYSGDTGVATLRSRWQEEAGRPVIVKVEPAD